MLMKHLDEFPDIYLTMIIQKIFMQKKFVSNDLKQSMIISDVGFRKGIQ